MLNPSIEALNREISTLNTPENRLPLEAHSLPFWGGVIGHFNYEYDDKTKDLCFEFGQQEKHQNRSDSVFGVYHWALIQDHEQRKACVVFLSSMEEPQRNLVLDTLVSAQANLDTEQDSGVFSVTHLKPHIKKSDYLAAVDKIQAYIRAGDTYQINFSQQFSGEFKGDTDATYIALRKTLPSPFSAYMELGDETILSLSPERFIQVKNDDVLTQPIKGTAPRGKTISDDDVLANQLMNSDKNRAENLMIVDLLRNDFSKSCRPHSVKTPQLFALESYANVHHLVSTITGKKHSSVSPLEFMMRCFPGGSITGAPKKRAMEIIDELEQHSRNIYCGSVCYINVDGQLDSNIAIRTLLVKEDRIYCWGGGGIVADSNAEEEYQESLHKVGSLLKALGQEP